MPNGKFASFYLLLFQIYGGLNMSNFRRRIEKFVNYVIWIGNVECEICFSLQIIHFQKYCDLFGPRIEKLAVFEIGDEEYKTCFLELWNCKMCVYLGLI